MKDENGSIKKLKQKDLRCIWMTAGVISFKLCPLDFNCEQCDFDKGLRQQHFDKERPPNKKYGGRGNQAKRGTTGL